MREREEEKGRSAEIGEGNEGDELGGKREDSYLHGWNVTNFLTKSCMFAYEWQCRTMCTCTILILNSPPE